MKRSSVAALSCLSCFLGLATAPLRSHAASPVPTAAPASTSPQLLDGGNRLADNDYQGAVSSLQAVIRLQPSNQEAYRLLSLAYLHSGQYTKAADAAKNALRQPATKVADRATTLMIEGQADYDTFIEEYNRLRSQADTMPIVRQLYAQMKTHVYHTGVYSAHGEYVVVGTGDASAVDDYEALRASAREDIRQLSASLKAAEEEYQEALTDDPHLSGLHDGLGLIRMAQGYPEEARHEYLTEQTQHGPSGVVYLHIGEVDNAEGRVAEAIENFRLAIRLTPKLCAAYDDIGPLYTAQHDLGHAQWAKGMAFFHRGDLNSAERALTASAPVTGDLLKALAELAVARHHDTDARALLEKATALDPRDAEAAVRLGDVEEASGHHPQALDQYRRALEFDQSCDAAWNGIGIVYDALGDRLSAQADYKQALEICPNNIAAKLGLITDEAALGSNAEAAANLQDFLERFPTASNRFCVQTTLAQMSSH